MSTRNNLELFDKYEVVGEIPNPRGADSPIRKKILEYLSSFEVGEIRRLDCVNMNESKQFTSRLRQYAGEKLSRVFKICQREESVYVERKKDVEHGPEKLHNEHSS